MYCEFEDLKGKILEKIVKSDDRLDFYTINKEHYIMEHYQECCESVFIADICGDLDSLLNQEILIAKQVSSDGRNAWGEGENSEWTFYIIATNKETVTIRWYGESNGYYSTSVDFKKEEVRR